MASLKIRGRVGITKLFAFLFLIFICSSSFAAPVTLTQSVTYSGETITMQLAREDLRGSLFELLAQNSSGGYDTISPVDERSYIGTVDEYPGAVSCGVLKDNGTFWGAVYFDRGVTWFTLGTSVYETRALDYGTFSSFEFPASSSVTPGQAGTTMYGYDLGVDADYNYYSNAGSTAAAFEQIEFSVCVVRAIYMRDVLLRPYLGRVIIRATLAQDPYTGLTQGDYLSEVRSHWNTYQNDVDHDLVAGVSPTKIGGGLAWVGVVDTSSGYSVSQCNSYGAFDVVFRHEMGHNWGCGHYVGGSPEGKGLMGGNAPGRFSACEAYVVLVHRDSRLGSFVNTGTYISVDLPPYAAMDSMILEIASGSNVTFDILANDFDANGDTISILSFDSLSDNGAAVTLSPGTGPGGRDELIYTQGNEIGLDYFLYTIVDSTGQTATGVVIIDVQPDDLLRLYLKLDETSGTTAIDSSPFDNTATGEGGLDFGTDSVAGRFSNAIDLDGTDDHIYVPGMNFNSNTVTISAWVNVPAIPADWSGIVLDRSDSANGINFATGGELRYHWNGTNWSWASGLYVPNNTWTFVALVVEPTKATIYMNTGTTTQSITHYGTHNASSFANTYIGYDTNSSARHLLGSVDDVRIYNSSMTPIEIENLIAGGGAEGPNPYDQATGINSGLLRWATGADSVSNNVYIGTSQTAVANATAASPEYKGSVTVAGYLANLNPSTTYYWRIDTVTSLTTLTGTVWSFTTAAAIDDISNGIITHLTMDDADISSSTVNDVSGTPIYDGTIQGATPGSIGQMEQALTFDGNDDRVTIPATYMNSNTVSISAWVKRNGSQSDYTGIVIAAKGGTTTKSGLNFIGGDKLGYHWNGEYWSWNSGLTIPDNQWAHVAIVVEPSKATLYVNGVSAVSSGTHDADEFNSPFDIGTYDMWSSRMFTGSIDDVAIWNSSLSEDQIMSIYYTGLQGNTFTGDETAPTPNPMTFDVPPHPTGTSSISMTATTAVDPRGVEYYFLCSEGGGNTSEWQASPTYTDTGLLPDVQYSYKVKARDLSNNYNTTVKSAASSTIIDLYDGKLGLPDFASFAQQWLNTNCEFCNGADLTDDQNVDMDDLEVFVGNWMN